MKKYQLQERVFILDSLGRHSATITDIMKSAYGDSYIYFCKQDSGELTWESEINLLPLVYKEGDKIISDYGEGTVSNAVNGLYKVTYSFGSLYHLEGELKPDNTPKKKSLWRILFAR